MSLDEIMIHHSQMLSEQWILHLYDPIIAQPAITQWHSWPQKRVCSDFIAFLGIQPVPLEFGKLIPIKSSGCEKILQN